MFGTSAETHTQCDKPRIVDDLIPIILESSDHWWPRDFQRLTLVSPGWLGPIRRRLYACPVLHTFHACSLFVRTVTDNPHILSLVQGINLSPMLPSDSSYCLSEKDMASLRFILNLKGLQTVTIGGELAVQAERFIQMMSNTRSITSLHIDGSHIQDNDSLDCRQPASLEWNETIAFRFTKLQSLRLTGLNLGISHPPMPYSLRVQDLILDDISISHGFLQYLLHESWDTVRNVSVFARTTENSEDLVRELLECCENLESLQFESCGQRVRGEIFADDLPLPALRKLRLYDIQVNPQTLAVVGQTCRGLEHLSVLGRAVRVKSSDWTDFLQSKALPSLHYLSIPSGANEPPYGFLRWTEETRKSVMEECVSRGLSLSFDA